MADKLTPQQAQAVQNRGGCLLVSAAAGSGKTKVLVDRLLAYLTDDTDPANLDEFLIITYTKAAASELRGKIAARLTERIAEDSDNKHLQKQIQRLFLTKISTIHGFCGDILREYAYRLDLPADFRVADENECNEIRETVLKQMLEAAYEKADGNSDFLAFVDSQGIGRDDRLIPELICRVYDSACCHLNPDEWLRNCVSNSCADPDKDPGDTVWGAYLIAALHSYLDLQLRALSECAQALDEAEGMQKPAANLRDTIFQLQQLRQSSTWSEIVLHKDIDFGRLTFPRKNTDEALAARVKEIRGACKKELDKKVKIFSDEPHQVMEDLIQSSAGVRGLVEQVLQFKSLYSAAKRSRRVLDFSDLEQKTLDLLLGKSRSGATVIADEIGSRFREVLVDEYQDSNGIQDAIFSALTRKKQNCFLVGDVKQSIYQFRLADPEIFLEKYKTFVPTDEAKPMDGRKVLLCHNFRSGPEVIEAVNAVFSRCMSDCVGGLEYGEPEQLREGVPHAPLPDSAVELHCLQTGENGYAEEAEFVADKIKSMLQDRTLIRNGDSLVPVKPDDIVILLRSANSVGGIFKRALEEQGIRCVTGGGVDLLHTEEISTLRSFLQIIWNPRQDIPLISVLASPIFCFSADELARIRGKQKSGSIYDALISSQYPKAQHFVETLRLLRREARMNTIAGLLQKCFEVTRLDSIFATRSDGSAKAINIQAFYQMAADYEKNSMRDLSQFLSYLDSMEDKGLPAAGSASQGAVSIMSIHKSKGLEFPVVFLCNLSRAFNKTSLHAQLLCDRDLGIGLSAADNQNRVRYPTIAKRAIAEKMEQNSVSEEIRVLYVAMTRARDRLIMTYSSDSLEKKLKSIALRMDCDKGQLVSRDVSCPGDWVLLTALGRTEAGQLHALGDRPLETIGSDYPWRIQAASAQEYHIQSAALEKSAEHMPQDLEQQIRIALGFHYSFTPATTAPSKQTATGLKGRDKDAEAAQDTREHYASPRSWHHPEFLTGKKDSVAYGNAIHLAMQYLRYENCGTLQDTRREVSRLAEEGYLSKEQMQMVNCSQIHAFFLTQIGQKLRNGAPHIREYKFSILDDGIRYGDGLEGEQVLLQGVVDCALLEESGITVLDFKTDHVTEENVEVTAERYRPQVEAYANALSRIFEKPVTEKMLYFFRLGRFVSLS